VCTPDGGSGIAGVAAEGAATEDPVTDLSPSLVGAEGAHADEWGDDAWWQGGDDRARELFTLDRSAMLILVAVHCSVVPHVSSDALGRAPSVWIGPQLPLFLACTCALVHLLWVRRLKGSCTYSSGDLLGARWSEWLLIVAAI
jgi:hypothetical protein